MNKIVLAMSVMMLVLGITSKSRAANCVFIVDASSVTITGSGSETFTVFQEILDSGGSNTMS